MSALQTKYRLQSLNLEKSIYSIYGKKMATNGITCQTSYSTKYVWYIMASTPDGELFSTTEGAKDCQRVSWLNPSSLVEWGWGSHLSWGQASCPQHLVCTLGCQGTSILMLNSWIGKWSSQMTPLSQRGPGSSASSGGMPAMNNGGQPPTAIEWVPQIPGRGVGGWLSDSTCHSTTSWVRVVCEVVWVVVVVVVLVISCHRSSIRSLLSEPGSFCYGCSLTELALPIRVNWSPTNWRAELPWELPHWWKWPAVPSPTRPLSHSLPDSEAHWGSAVGPFPPSIEGLLCRWGSSVVAQASSLDCQSMGLEVAWTCIILTDEWASGEEWSLSSPITWIHAFGTLNDAHTFHVNSWWSSWPGTSCSPHHQTGMSTCVHATVSSPHFPWGKVQSHWALKFMGGHPLLLCQPEMSHLHSRVPGDEASEGAGPQNFPLLFWAQTSWIGHLAPSDLPRLARAASGPHLSQYPSWAIFRWWGAHPSAKVTHCLGWEAWVTELTF